MLSFETLFLIVLAGLLFWFWQDSLKVREKSLHICHRICTELDVQFLDQTVTTDRIRFRRNKKGRVTLVRYLHFDFSTDGADRRFGEIVIAGYKVESLFLDLPEGGTHVDLPFKGSESFKHHKHTNIL